MEETSKRSGRGRKNVKFNVLDLVIIIVAAFLIAIAVMLTMSGSQKIIAAGEKVQITYKVEFSGLSKDYYDKIQAEQTVTESDSGCALGTVSEVIYEDSYEFAVVTDAEGNNIAEKHTDSELLGYNVTVTVTAKAVYNEGTGYTADGYRIAVGKEMNLRFADFTGTGKCVSVEFAG